MELQTESTEKRKDEAYRKLNREMLHAVALERQTGADTFTTFQDGSDDALLNLIQLGAHPEYTLLYWYNKPHV